MMLEKQLKLVIVGCTFCFASSASAQIAGCETVGGELFCPPKDASGGHLAGFRMRVEKAREALKLKERERRDEYETALALRKKVGSHIASGDCLTAYNTALTDGDLALAVEVKKLCDAPPE